MKSQLTREQAIQIAGIEAVEKVEAMGCEPTNRVGYNGAGHGDELTEWSASVKATDKDGTPVRLIAYYYTNNEEDQAMADAGSDGSVIDWEISHYSVTQERLTSENKCQAICLAFCFIRPLA